MPDEFKTHSSPRGTSNDLDGGQPESCTPGDRFVEAKEARRRILDQLVKAFDLTGDSVLIARLGDGTILDVNDRFVQSMGYTRAEVLGRSASALDLWTDPDARQRFSNALKERLECSGMDTAFKAKNGSMIPVTVSGRVAELAGEPCGIAIIRDRSRFMPAGQDASRSEDRYRQLVEFANDVIYMTDERGRFTFVNPAALRITGYSEQELIGKYYLDLIHPDHRQQAGEFYRSQFERKIPSTYYEFPILAKGGEDVWLGQNVQLVLEDDRVAGFRSICRDITERKRTEEQLFRSESRFRYLSEAAPFGLSVMRKDKKFRYHNPKFTEIFGYTIGDVPDKDTWFLNAYPDEEYRKQVISVWTQDTRQDAVPGEISPRVFTVRCKDGSDKIIQFRAVVMEQGWQILTYEDITLQAKSAQALHESETKYRSLFEEANDAIFLMRGEFVIDCNARALDIFGCPRQQIVGDSLLRFSPQCQPDGGDSRARALEFIGQALAGQKQIFQWRCARFDGASFDAEVSLSRMELSGEMVLLLVLRDVTDRVRAEEALLEKEQMLRNILAASPVGIARLDERTIRWGNEAMIRMFGFESAEELIGRTTRDLYASPKEYDRVGERLYETSMPRTETETYAQLVRKDGSIFDGHVRISAPDPLDRTKGTIASFSDVSKLRQAEQALAESERRYRTLVESVPDVIFSLDATGCFTFVNAQAEKFLGYSVAKMIGTPLWDYAGPEYGKLAESVVQVSREEIWDEELGVLDSSGERKWVRIRCQSSCDEHGERLGFEGVMMDRTFRRQLEEELRASKEELQAKMKIIDDLYAHVVQSEKAKAIAEHTAEVAHELRQPLAIIGGFARRMAQKLETGPSIDVDRQKQSFQIITREVKRLEEILGGLIEFSRRRTIQLKRVDPNTIVTRVLRVHEERLEEKDLQLETHLAKDIGEIYLDEKRFEQVVRNLVSNAIEASDREGVVRVDTGIFTPSDKAQKTGELDAGRYFELLVQNGGKMIPAEQLHRLFEPFYTTKEDGIGMGLTLSKKIIEEHGGSVSVKSDEEGTVFTVWIPMRPPQPDSSREPDS